MARLDLTLFGIFQAHLNGALLTGFDSNKTRGLLAYLAVENHCPHSRESLATLLWPDWSQNQALTYLRNTLANLRHIMEDGNAAVPFLLVTHDTLQFNSASDCWLDVNIFQLLSQVSEIPNPQASLRYATVTRLEQAVEIYQGDFLAGLAIDSLPFEEWALLKREHCHQKMLETLHRLADFYLACREYERCITHARRQVEMEPWREEAYQQWMHALTLSGQRSQALTLYQTCCRRLRDELGVVPGVETTRLYQAIRNETLAPAPPIQVKRHNLPAPLTSFIGREKQIIEIKQLILTNQKTTFSRLVTLTGAGGVGKTRLAIQVAGELLDQFPDGVWLADLARISDPSLVPTVSAQAIGLRGVVGAASINLLQNYLESRQVLLILDNCEHLREAPVQLSAALLPACPGLTILATSRAALGLTGEIVYDVPSLSFPEAQAIPEPALTPENIQHYEAIRLFGERSAAIVPGFTFDEANSASIAQICIRLDGIPLAIELAAVSIKILDAQQIAQRLDGCFNLLTGGSPVNLPRHQTLRASIDWSYGLLTPAEQNLLQRLSVFVGGWTLEAAELVGAEVDRSAESILELLGNLVSQSLVVVEDQPGSTKRYRMLETIRQYAREKLSESGQIEQVRQRHLQYYLELAERIKDKIRGPELPILLGHLETELNNIRQALQWSLIQKDQMGWNIHAGLRLASALWHFWHIHGRHDEGVQWLQSLLAGELETRDNQLFTPERVRARARALQVAGYLIGYVNLEPSTGYIEESLRLYRQLGAERESDYAMALWTLAGRVLIMGDLEKSQQLNDQALAIFQYQEDLFGISECLLTFGWRAINAQEYHKAREVLEQDLAIKEEIGDLDGIAGALYFLGLAAFEQGDDKQAQFYFTQAERQASEIHADWLMNNIRIYLAVYHCANKKYGQANELLDQFLSTAQRIGDVESISLGFNNLSEVASYQGEYNLAIEKLKAGLAYFRKKDYPIYITFLLFNWGNLAWASGEYEQAIALLTEALGRCREAKNKVYEAVILSFLGKVSIAMEKHQSAQLYLTEAVRIWLSSGMASWYTTPGVETAAYLMAHLGQRLQAACLLGATENFHRRFTYARTPKERQLRVDYLASVRSTMNEQAFNAAWEKGGAMNLRQAVEFALKELSS